MKGKIRFAALAVIAAAALVFGVMLAPRSEAGGGKPSGNVPLVASVRQVITDPSAVPYPMPSDRILGDNKGSYINGVAAAGAVDVFLSDPAKLSGSFYMNLDNGGDLDLGRALGFLFYDWTHSCEVDGPPNSTEFLDFPIGPGTLPVMTKWLKIQTWFLFEYDPADGFYKENSSKMLNFAKMGINGNPGLAYVGMSIQFGYPLDPTPADEYSVGFRWDPVEVEALSIGPNGPTRWAIRPIQDPAVYTKIVATTYKPYVPSRMLWQVHYLKKGYKAYCYGIYSMPFEITLNLK